MAPYAAFVEVARQRGRLLPPAVVLFDEVAPVAWERLLGDAADARALELRGVDLAAGPDWSVAVRRDPAAFARAFFGREVDAWQLRQLEALLENRESVTRDTGVPSRVTPGVTPWVPVPGGVSLRGGRRGGRLSLGDVDAWHRRRWAEVLEGVLDGAIDVPDG